MDFINHRIKKLNLDPDGHFEYLNHIPKKHSNELEQLNNNLYKTIKMRMEYPNGNNNDQDSFEKMLQQMQGKDISNLSDLTQEFSKKAKRSYG
ncbi:MAG: hypothetical protein ACTHL3_08310 [Candidatus Nitrosocosmicus sp.]